jgi:uncharacterized membrane protein
VPAREVKERLAADVALWQEDGIIDDATRLLLAARYDAPGFGLTTAVKYLGVAGGVFTVFGIMGLGAAITSSEASAALMLALVGALGLYAGLHLAADPSARYVHSSKVVIAIAWFAAAGALGLFTHALKMSEAATVVLVGAGALPIAFGLAYRGKNTFLLLIGVLGFFQWVGSWNRMLGRSTYAFEIADPRAMCLVSLGVFAVGVWHERAWEARLPRFSDVYQATALVYFNMSLLILSIWPAETASSYVVVFTLAALGQIVLAARLKSALTMGFGVTAFAVDLFTRYSEHFWGRFGQGLFFLVGGLLLMGFGAAVERALKRWAH